jgi:hypothetical protein
VESKDRVLELASRSLGKFATGRIRPIGGLGMTISLAPNCLDFFALWIDIFLSRSDSPEPPLNYRYYS